MALPTKNRLKKKKHFDRVFRVREGSALKGSFLFMRYLDNGADTPHLGFVIPSKVLDKAVARNRIKRVLAETASRYLKILTGQDILVILKKAGDEGTIKSELESLLNKIGHIK